MNCKSETIAVIMAIYDGDDAIFFKKAVDSVYAQTYHKYDIYLYVDAVKRNELIALISTYQHRDNFFITYGEDRKGLAYGLNCLLDEIKNKGYGFIARMDSDDISIADRFKLQVQFLQDNKSISVVGTNCIEIDSNGNEIFHKKMPETHKDILASVIKRSPFIHPSVMFRGGIIEDVRYDNNLINTQDYYLWIDLISKYHLLHNIQKPLLNFRVNETFYTRRGFSKIANEAKSRLYAIRVLKRHSIKNYIYLVCLIMLRLAPVGIKKYCYMRFR